MLFLYNFCINLHQSPEYTHTYTYTTHTHTHKHVYSNLFLFVHKLFKVKNTVSLKTNVIHFIIKQTNIALLLKKKKKCDGGSTLQHVLKIIKYKEETLNIGIGYE